MNPEIDLLAFAAVENLKAAGLSVTTAESCTGGMIATALTEVPGVSQVFRYGWVTYCNEAKERLLNVPASLIEEHTVVSEPVVAAMATAAMRQSGADIAIAVSGNAGPAAPEGEPEVGTVCIAIARRGAARPVHTETLYMPGLERRQFRQRVTAKVLQLIASAAN